MMSLNRLQCIAFLFYFISLIFVCYFSTQKHFVSILIPSSIAFFSYFLLLKSLDKIGNFKEVLILIALLKISIVFSFPHLSDDIYRFWWDGYLSCNGFNPYEFSPNEVISSFQSENIYPSLLKNFTLLNSANYHSVYPLVCQWIFYFSASISGDDLYVFNIILKIIFLIADGLILYFLLKLQKLLRLAKTKMVLYYANPLCIIELYGNLHFEIFLILFLIVSIYFFVKNKFILSGLYLGVSIVSKLVSLLWFPLFIKRPFWKKAPFFFIGGLLIPISIFIVTLLPTGIDYQNSLGLYFQKFEFNSFVYGPLIAYFNYQKWYSDIPTISFALMCIFCMIYTIIIVNDWRKHNAGFSFQSAWLILFSYLLLSTTVHPWYLTPLIFLSVFSYRQTGKVWSFLVLFSYVRYDPVFASMKSYIIVLEYAIVIGFFFYESYKAKRTVIEMEQNID